MLEAGINLGNRVFSNVEVVNENTATVKIKEKRGVLERYELTDGTPCMLAKLMKTKNSKRERSSGVIWKNVMLPAALVHR